MKFLITVLAGAGLFFSHVGTASSAELSAQQILARVGETYRGLHDYQIEAVQTAVISMSGYGSAVSDAHFSLAVSAPGKMRLTVKDSEQNLLVISDGRATWWYLPAKKIYTRVSAAATLPAGGEDDDEEADMVTQAERALVERYIGAVRFAPGAILKGEDQLKLGGAKVRCHVIELRQTGSTHELWVDADRFLVLRHKEQVLSVKNDLKTQTQVQTDLRQVIMGTPPADLFDFTPPPKAREVQALGIHGEHVSLAGKSAMDFALKDTQGARVSLSDFRGKVVLLDFWATWCPPCREELPHIDGLYRKLKDKDLVVLGVNDEDAGTVRSFLKKNAYELPSLVDSSRAVHKLYGVRAIPTLIIIDRNGVVTANYVGGRTEDQLMTALKAAGLSE